MESNTASNNRRLAKNTIFLYFRMMLLMFVGLYASRVVLKTLGVNDYGLYNVVGGVVTMFSFLNATLSTSTQRFLNIEIGRGAEGNVKRVFSNALALHAILALLILLLAETVGLWFVLNKLVVPEGREMAALWIYQFSILAVCVQVVQLPFMSVLIAHEKMDVYAYVSIYEAIAKLLIVFLIQVVPADRLILYGGLVLVVQLSVAMVYNVYCRKHYEEATFKLDYEKNLFREMLGFSGWNVVGCMGGVCNSQGVNLILNHFFGTVVNAAQGVAFQVEGLVMQLVSNFQLAVKPQVIKYYAAGQKEEMVNLVFNSARYSALLMAIVVIPVMLEIKPLLTLWLGEYPEYTPAFVEIILFRMIISAMTGCVVMVVHASGHLRNVGICGGGVLLMVLPICYVLLRMGCPPMIPFVVNIFAALGETFFELYWMRHYINFPMGRFYKEVYGRVFALFLLMFAVPASLDYLLSGIHDYIRMVLVGAFSVLFSLFVVYQWGIGKVMRQEIQNKVRNYLKIR